MDSDDIMDSDSFVNSNNDLYDYIMDPNDDFIDSNDYIIDSNDDLIDSNNDFIAPSSSFGVHWTGFLHFKQFKNNKAHRYNAKCIHCDQIFEACKESMKSSNKTIEESTDTTSISSSTLEKNNAGLMTNYFYKAAILLTKIDELHTLLLHALIYSNVPFKFVENPWMDVSNNSIYAFILHKSEDINEIINIDDFSITDSPSVMVKLRKNVSEKYLHIIGIRCCLHVFNLIAKGISSYHKHKNTVKKNLILVNFFTSLHFWNTKLKQWALENNIKNGLQTFCETRWYSLSKVCLSVQNFEAEIIFSRHHFLKNEELTKILRYVVDAIARLELHKFIDHAKDIINFRAKEFDEPIYYLAFFLNPRFRNIANFTREQAQQISKTILDYYNNEPPFNLIGDLKPQ
ncbi:13536_t:CDS:2, partial [Gigaspora rosea]